MTEYFDVTRRGTSHGEGITTIIKNCPSNILIDEDFIQQELTRRKPGQVLTTERQEADEFEFRGGISKEGYTTGRDIKIFVPNTGQHSFAYDKLLEKLRPGHGITMYILKMLSQGKKIEDLDLAGGGQASARLTIGNVAAGAIAQLALDQMIPERNIKVNACIEQVGRINADIKTEDPLSEDIIYESIVRCPKPEISHQIVSLLTEYSQSGDSLGGVVYCRVDGYPGGIGERPDNELDGIMAGAIVKINGVKGVDIGDPDSHLKSGSETIDEIKGFSDTDLFTYSNHAGGFLGGLTTGGIPIEIRAKFKPTSSIKKELRTVGIDGEPTTILLGSEDRHDPCIAIRGTEVVKGVVRTVLLQQWLKEINKKY